MEVVVGSGASISTWNIPKALLSRHSDYFRAACNGNFKEGIESRVPLNDVEPRLFQHFVQWLYFATAPRLPDVDGVYDGFRLWVLGDRLMSSGFKNLVMTRLFNVYSRDRKALDVLSTAEVTYCWNNTAPGSHLQLFLLHTFSQHWVYEEYMKADTKGWEALLSNLPDLHLRLTTELVGLCADGKGKPTIKPLETYLEDEKD
jgi:hypothetical protein